MPPRVLFWQSATRGVAARLLPGPRLKGASLNIYINTKSMKDRTRAEELNSKCDEMIRRYSEKAEAIFDSVLEKLK